jgi:hypothetical protein
MLLYSPFSTVTIFRLYIYDKLFVTIIPILKFIFIPGPLSITIQSIFLKKSSFVYLDKVIKLSKNVFDYSVDIDGSDPIEVSATTSDPLAIATVSGIDEFNTSKQITISVMAEDGSVRVYKIINKNKPSLVPVIVASAVSFLSIISAVILIIKHRKKATDIAMPAINSTNDIVGQDTKPDQQPTNDSVDITRI